MSCGSARWRSCCACWPRSTPPGAPRAPRPQTLCVTSEPSMNEVVLDARDVHKSFRQGSVTLDVRRGINLAVRSGERIAIVGASGSGKTTLLQLLGGLDKPTSGHVIVDGRDIHELGEEARGELRNRAIGFVYQFHHLLPEFSALENVAMPLLVRLMKVTEARARAGALLERVGLGERLDHRPYQLSGGERQRAAVARALVTEPRLIMADEPTGNLDGVNAESVFTLMLELNRERRTSLVVVTHDLRLAGRMERTLEIEQGQVRDRPAAPQATVEASLRER